MEHCDNIEEKADPTENLLNCSGVSSKIDHQVTIQINKTVQFMNEKIHGLPPLLPEPCIFKVHEGLHKGNKEAYTPKLVSIGPYHHSYSKLHPMEEHKWRYLHSLLQRLNNNNNNNTSVEPYLLLMEKLADEARGYYADPIDLTRYEFVQMLLLDACFIIEFLRKSIFRGLIDKNDPIFRSDWMHAQVCHDLILLENQLPFFVLSKLFDMTQSQWALPLTFLAFIPFSNVLDIKGYFWEKFDKKNPASEVKHFLDLVHRFYVPSRRENSESSGDRKYFTQMSCVTELQEAGISFKVDDSDDVRIFDIIFEHGHMKIPKFRIQDRTETYLRNIIAYEQHSSSVGIKYFTDYQYFMDLLINKEKDVGVLRLHEIIDNMLGDVDEVARMFNKMGDGVGIDPSKFYYSHICEKVNKHCKKPWNQAIAKLRRNYFHNPWAGISTVAAAVLLLLTLTQTITAVNPLFG